MNQDVVNLDCPDLDEPGVLEQIEAKLHQLYVTDRPGPTVGGRSGQRSKPFGGEPDLLERSFIVG